MDAVHRRAQFKKGLSSASARKSRNEMTAAIRKTKKVEALAKRRNMRMPTAPVDGAIVPAPNAAAAPPVPGATVPPAANATAIVGTTTPATPAATGPVFVANLAEYVAAVKSTDAAAQFKGTNAIRRLLSKERDPPVKEVLGSGVLPFLVNFLNSTNDKLQFEAAWAITNVASTEYTGAVVEAKATPLLVNLLRSPSADVREQCIWCLGNIAGDGPHFRDMVLNIPDAVNNLLLNIKHPANDSLLKNATWTLSNYCRGKPQPPLEAVRPLIPALAHLLGSSDEEVLTDACWGLSYLTDGENARIQAVVDSGVTTRLVQLLAHPSYKVVIPALRTAGNIVTGSDVQTQAVIDAAGLPAFAHLINHDRKNIRREACWASSNVAAGTPPQITALVDTPHMVPALLTQLRDGEWNVRKEACWAISNVATSGPPDCVHKLVAAGSISPLAKMLTVGDDKIVQVALEAVSSILDAERAPAGGKEYSVMFEEAEGVDNLERLQEHTNTEIYEKAVELIEAHFGVDDGEEDENVAPGVSSGAKSFAFGFPAAPAAPAATAQPATFGFGAAPSAPATAPSNPFNFTGFS